MLVVIVGAAGCFAACWLLTVGRKPLRRSFVLPVVLAEISNIIYEVTLILPRQQQQLVAEFRTAVRLADIFSERLNVLFAGAPKLPVDPNNFG